MKITEIAPSSFRDPSGFLFTRSGTLYRQINKLYEKEYGHLMRSGLYESLTRDGFLIPHEEVSEPPAREDSAHIVIHPERIPFVSYPYEGCFGELKDAALLTLDVQKRALEHGMVLKDASAYNIQFRHGKPIFIDTLSFDFYKEGKPWEGYRQFCQHFLAPLALMVYTDVRLREFLRIYIDGIPLDLARALLPFSSIFRPSLLIHIIFHAKTQARFAGRETKDHSSRFMNRKTMLELADNLRSSVAALQWKFSRTEWGEYYRETNYSSGSFSEKAELVEKMTERADPKTLWDIGANTGVFSRIASKRGVYTISIDSDPAAVEKNYQTRDNNTLPLVMDLTNPSPALGWDHRERLSLKDRGPADMVLALALIHHLVISNNLPFSTVARFFADICKTLVIEFVPKSDSNTRRLLKSRKDIFPEYTKRHFEEAFSMLFVIKESVPISGSERVLYYMEKR